jgi:hypothetical protein
MDNEEYILNCKFAFKCTETWDALERTEEDGVRYCNACERTVTFIRSQADQESAAAQGKCVAAYVRSEGFDDLPGVDEPLPPCVTLGDIVLPPPEPVEIWCYLKGKAQKIVADPRKVYWTPQERAAIRAHLGPQSNDFSDLKLAQALLELGAGIPQDLGPIPASPGASQDHVRDLGDIE